MNIYRVSKNDNFSIISNVILRDKNVSLKAKGLLAIILSLPPNWEISINGLAAITQEGRGAIETGIKELIKTGYCKRKQLKVDNKFAGYEYTFYEATDNMKYANLPYTENQDTGNSFTENQEQINTDILNTDLKKERKNIINVHSENFDRFWNLYPRKVNKKKAESLFKKLDIETQEKIINVLPNFIKSDKWKDVQYIPHPTTFLNGERWNDEVLQKPKVQRKIQELFLEPDDLFKLRFENNMEQYHKFIETIKQHNGFYIFEDRISISNLFDNIMKLKTKEKILEALDTWDVIALEFEQKYPTKNMNSLFRTFLEETYPSYFEDNK